MICSTSRWLNEPCPIGKSSNTVEEREAGMIPRGFIRLRKYRSLHEDNINHETRARYCATPLILRTVATPLALVLRIGASIIYSEGFSDLGFLIFCYSLTRCPQRLPTKRWPPSSLFQCPMFPRLPHQLSRNWLPYLKSPRHSMLPSYAPIPPPSPRMELHRKTGCHSPTGSTWP